MLRVEDHGAVRVITLDRPEKRNALDTALTQALLDALLAADADPGVRAIVLAGAGRGFCAGADLAEFAGLTPAHAERVARRAELTSRTQSVMQSLAKPVVSAVQGAAMGGGAGLAIGADMMVAAEDCRLGYPELRHAIVPALVMTGLQRHFGRKLAFELVSLGRILGAAELLTLGVANRVVPPDALLPTALDIATTWAGANPQAMAAAKALLYRVADLPTEPAMAAGLAVNVQMRGFRP